MISVGSEVQILPGPPKRGRSSAGRAPALQAGGHRFEPVRLHHSAASWRSDVRSEPSLPLARLPLGDPLFLGCLSWVCGLVLALGAGPVSSQRSNRFGPFVPSRLAAVGMNGPLCCCHLRPRPWVGAAFVLCQCESGSGASLDASSAASLTGKWVSRKRSQAASLLGGTCVQRRFVSIPLSVMRVGAYVYVLSKLACVCWFETSQNVNQTKRLVKVGVKSGCGWFLCMVGYVGCLGVCPRGQRF